MRTPTPPSYLVIICLTTRRTPGDRWPEKTLSTRHPILPISCNRQKQRILSGTQIIRTHTPKHVSPPLVCRASGR